MALFSRQPEPLGRFGLVFPDTGPGRLQGWFNLVCLTEHHDRPAFQILMSSEVFLG